MSDAIERAASEGLPMVDGIAPRIRKVEGYRSWVIDNGDERGYRLLGDGQWRNYYEVRTSDVCAWPTRECAEAFLASLAAPAQPQPSLNLDTDEARALHRIVRAMHDGECPKCHAVHDAEYMRSCYAVEVSDDNHGWRCPRCSFTIHSEEAAEVFRIFAPFMERNLAVFEKWRASRKQADSVR